MDRRKAGCDSALIVKVRRGRVGDQQTGVMPRVSNEELISWKADPRLSHQRQKMEGWSRVMEAELLRRSA